MKILREKPIWPKENSVCSQSSKGAKEIGLQRFIARDLYTPIALHREFGLPIIDWKGKWARNMHEGILIICFYMNNFSLLTYN
jgi:hypothetical protein